MKFRWVKLPGTELLPGDVVSVGRDSGHSGEDKSVPADMLILAGSAIVNEAILTGESTPQWKVIFFQCVYFCRNLQDTHTKKKKKVPPNTKENKKWRSAYLQPPKIIK